LLAVRALTAAALLAAFVAALWLLERAAFGLVVGAVLALAAHEWARLSGLGRAAGHAYAAGCVLLYAVSLGGLWPLRADDTAVLAVLGGACAFWSLAVPPWMASGMTAASRGRLAVAGLAVLLPAGVAMALLPPALLLALLGLVWVGDTAAYLAGSAFGRHKLAPSISPGKTWEGAAGAVLASLAYAIILGAAMPQIGDRVKGPGWAAYLAGAILLCAAGIVGDLFESALKRRAGAKDSGAVLPGHGGVLDRIDSATAVLPVGALLLAWLGAL
jgi:phosphatidate cytidylyltransferase